MIMRRRLRPLSRAIRRLFFFLRPFSPKSLFGRALLILLIPLVLIQIIVGAVFVERLFGDVTDQMSATTAPLLRELALSPSGEAPPLAKALNILRIDPPQPLPNPRFGRSEWEDVSARYVFRALERHVPELLAVDLSAARGRVHLWLDAPGAPTGIIQFDLPRAMLSANNPHQLLVLMIFASLMLGAVAVVFLRNQLRPIRQLARAAEGFGRGAHLPVHPRGAREVRAAMHAFLEMRARIERHIEQRSLMLSGVGHDLKTPLTRIKLALSLLDLGPEQEEVMRDIDQMARMLDEYLDFARGDALEAPEEMSLEALIRRFRLRFGGREIELRIDEGIDGNARLLLRSLALERAIDNLLSNATRHGARQMLSLSQRGGMLEIAVDDDGPGIAEADRARALRPFVRLEEARSLSKDSGVGLGLSIAADIAKAHGGVLILEDSPLFSGLRARISIPLQRMTTTAHGAII